MAMERKTKEKNETYQIRVGLGIVRSRQGGRSSWQIGGSWQGGVRVLRGSREFREGWCFRSSRRTGVCIRVLRGEGSSQLGGYSSRRWAGLHKSTDLRPMDENSSQICRSATDGREFAAGQA